MTTVGFKCGPPDTRGKKAHAQLNKQNCAGRIVPRLPTFLSPRRTHRGFASRCGAVVAGGASRRTTGMQVAIKTTVGCSRVVCSVSPTAPSRGGGCPGCPGCVLPPAGTPISTSRRLWCQYLRGVPGVPAESLTYADVCACVCSRLTHNSCSISRDSRDTLGLQRRGASHAANIRPTPSRDTPGQPGHPGRRRRLRWSG